AADKLVTLCDLLPLSADHTDRRRLAGGGLRRRLRRQQSESEDHREAGNGYRLIHLGLRRQFLRSTFKPEHRLDLVFAAAPTVPKAHCWPKPKQPNTARPPGLPLAP